MGRDESHHVPPGQPLDLGDEAVLHRPLKDAARFVNQRLALELDHRLLDVGVDVAEHAREQVLAHHQGGRGVRLRP
jgi:hypothetical protein